MPENNAGNLMELLKYGWVLLIGAIGWMWNRMVGNIDQVKADLSDHILDDLKAHDQMKDEFVSHDYVKDDIKPWLNAIDKKMDKLVIQTADVIKRDEYKKDIGSLYSQVGDLRTQIARIEGGK